MSPVRPDFSPLGNPGALALPANIEKLRFNNAQFRQQIYPYGDGNSEVRFHRGFMAAYCAIPDPLLAVISVAT